jgi:predicted nucleic acid-binding protein
VRVVVDASTALSWIFVDKRDALARSCAKAVLRHGATVRAISYWEMQNALGAAERRKRVTAVELHELLKQFESLPIEVEPIGPTLAFGGEVDLARRMNLSIYDTAYLDTALRRGMLLMTRDAGLGAAADNLKIRWQR